MYLQLIFFSQYKLYVNFSYQLQLDLAFSDCTFYTEYSSSFVISAELICLSIYALRTDKLYFSSGPRVDENHDMNVFLKYSQQ